MAKDKIPSNQPELLDFNDYSPVRKIRVPFYAYNPNQNMISRDYQEILATDEFLQSFKTPDDIDQYKNFILGSELEKEFGTQPFEKIADQRAVFNPDADYLDINDTDTPERQAKAEIYNQLIKYQGRIPSPDFLQRSWGKSMTNSWIKLLTGEDTSGLYDNFSSNEKGFKYKGQQLNLSDSEARIFNDFLLRTSGEDIDKSFLDKVAETTVGLTMDLPLMLITGAIAGGVMKAGSIGRMLISSPNTLTRLIGNVAQQSINFNLLGLPQTVEATKDNGFGGLTDAVWHSTQMGLLASSTGAIGEQFFKPFQWVGVGKEFVKNNPLLAKDIGSLAGSFGFGYASEKFAGMSDADAIATGMAFAATHFTNPNAYRRIMREQMSKPVLIAYEKFDGKTNPFYNIPDYFVEKEGKLHKIDTNDFRDKGRITELDIEPIEITPAIREKVTPYNQSLEHTSIGFFDALAKSRYYEASKELYNRMIKDLPDDYVKENSEALRRFSLAIAANGAVENARKLFAKSKLPDDKDIQNRIIQLTNKHKLPYDAVKRYVISNLKEFSDNPAEFMAKLDRFEGKVPRAVEDINKLVADVDKIIVNNALAKHGLLELEQPNRRIIKPQDKEDFPAYFVRVMDTKYPNAVKTGLDADGKKIQTTDNWWGLDYEKYRTEQVMVQADYDSFQKKQKDTVKEKVKKEGIKQAKTQGKVEIGKGTTTQAKTSEKTIISTDINEKTQPKQNIEDLNLIKNITNAYTSKDATNKDEATKQFVDKAKQLLDEANVGRGTKEKHKITLDDIMGLMLKDANLSDAERKVIADNAYRVLGTPKDVKMSNVLRKFNPADEKHFREELWNDLTEKGIIKKIIDYHKVAKEETAKGKESLTEKESAEKYVEDKEVANLIDEEVARGGSESVTAKKIAESIGGDIVEPDRKQHEKLSPEQEALENIKETLTTAGYQITKPDIIKAREDGVITDGEASDLMRSMSGIKKRAVASESKYKKEVNSIEVLADNYMGKGLKIGEAIDKAVGEGNLTPEQGAELRKLYGRNLDTLYNTSNLSKLKPATPEERDTFIKQTKELLNIDVEFGEVPQEGIPEGQVRTAMTYTEDGKTKIRISELTDKKGFEEETFHATMLNALDQKEVTDALSKIAKWNGEMSDWGRAHEDLYRQYAASRAGYMPSNRLFEKIKDWLDTVARWFGLNGFKDAENFFRRYSRGLIKVSETGENLHTKYLKEMLNPDRMVDAERHYLETLALYNTVDLSSYREESEPKKLDILLRLFGKKNVVFTKALEFGRNARPPVIEAETSRSFDGKNRFGEIHKTAEEQIVRGISGIRAEIGREMWGDGGYLRAMSPEEIETFLDVKRKYEDYIRDSGTDNILEPSEFYKRYNMNDKQIAMIDAYQKYVKKFNQVARDSWSDYLFDQTTDLTKGISKRKLAKLVPDLVKEKNGKRYINLSEVNDYLSKPENADLKRKLADYIAKKMYPDRKGIYFNDVRPTNPNYIMIEMEKLSDNPNHTPIKNELGETIGYKDYVSTYAYNEKHAEELIKKWQQQGFDFATETDKKGKKHRIGYYHIKDLIQNQQWDKLTHHQLMNLIEAGHIQASYIDENGKVKHHPIIDRLMNAVRTGTFKQHSINKKYIRGMHNTEKEFETNLYRFGDEVLGIKRQTAIIDMQKKLANWRTDIDPLLKSPDVSQDVKDKESRAYGYAQKYVNNISHSDRNFIDGYKGYVGAWYTSMKPSFFFQQLMQGLQTTWHLARGDSKSGDSYFAEGTQDAWKLMMYLRAKNAGQSTDVFGISDEVADIYQWLADRKKLGKIGVAELTETKTDLEYKYLTGSAKIGEALKRTMNIPSAAIEKFTRMQSMMTFYRIGKERNLTGDELKHFIANKIDLSMSEWGVAGRSPLLASKTPGKGQAAIVKALDKGFFTFKTFGTHNLALYEYLMRNKMWGALGSKLMAGVAFHGVTKFPLAATVFALANIFTDDDMEYETMRLLEDLNDYVPNLGTVLSRGGGGIAGISMENLFDEKSLLPSDTWDNLKAKSWKGRLAESMLGAPYGLARDIISSADAMKDGLLYNISSDKYMSKEDKEKTLKNVYKITPLTMRNILNTFLYDKDGVELRGKTIIKKEDLDWRDVVLKMMSFNPLKYAKAYEEQFQGFPAKWSRINGKISELKRIRKDVGGNEARGLARELEKTIKERSLMMQSKEYREAKSKGLI